MTCLDWSFTRTVSGEGNRDPTIACWLSPETFSRVVAVRAAVASMLKSTDRLPTMALTLAGPAVGPKVTVVEAMPLAFVTPTGGSTVPSPARKVNAT